MNIDSPIADIPLIKSKKDPIGFSFLILLGVLFFCTFIWMLRKDLRPVANSILLVLSGVADILVWYIVSRFNNLYIFVDRLEVRSLSNQIKNVIYLNDIDRYYDSYDSETNKRSTLFLYKGLTTVCKISAANYSNFSEMRDALIRDKIRIVPKWEQ